MTTFSELYPDTLEGGAPDEDPIEAHEDDLDREPLYPVTVPLVGEDGNAFAILGRVNKALRRAGVPPEERARFNAEATSGDYDHLLATVMRWVDAA